MVTRIGERLKIFKGDAILFWIINDRAGNRLCIFLHYIGRKGEYMHSKDIYAPCFFIRQGGVT